MTGTAIYNRWRAIRQRTTNPTATGYKHYGGRGIHLCKEWTQSFKKFYEYMGEPPTPKHSIDRIDNSKGYEPGNVRWATKSEQAHNKRPRINKYGLSGVFSARGYIYSMISIENKKIYLGSFQTAQLAHKAYLNAVTKYCKYLI